MNIKLTTIPKITLLLFIFIAAGLLSACASTPQGGVLATVPADAATDVEATSPTEAPTITPAPIPTNTPIPDATGYILYVSNLDGQMNLYMTTPDGVEQKRFTASSSSDSTPRISPDGTRVAFVSTVDGNMDIYVLDIASLVSTRITSAPQKDSAPSWSVDGTMLAFESFRDGNFEIYVAEAKGSTQTNLTENPDFFQRQQPQGESQQTRLTNDPGGDHSPLWSPAGKVIAFESSRSGKGNIYLLELDGKTSPLTKSPEADFAHNWSPDGNMLAFKVAVGGDLSKICVVERSGLNERCLTNVPSEYSSPVWSPDGKFLAANAKQPKGYGIDVFNVADGSVTHLFNPEVDPRGAPFWSPDGFRLVFQAKAADGNMDLFSVLIPTNEFTRLTNSAAYDGEPVWVTK